MLKYPIHVPTPKRLSKNYHPAAVRECRKKIEDYINERAKDSPFTVLNCFEIADATSIDEEIIKRFLRPLTGSYYNITIYNPDLKDETSP
jgi:hypothetical protein